MHLLRPPLDSKQIPDLFNPRSLPVLVTRDGAIDAPRILVVPPEMPPGIIRWRMTLISLCGFWGSLGSFLSQFDKVTVLSELMA